MGRWTTFKPRGLFSFDSKSVKRAWHRLHAGDCEPQPDDSYLLEAWALFHNGRFEEAQRAALALGDEGCTLANKATCVYATQLEARLSVRQDLYQSVAERAADFLLHQPQSANAHFYMAYALGRYSQAISVTRALAQGMGSRIKGALETAIALQPRHADAHFALGAFHAEIVDKVGILIGSMTYGARVDTCLSMFESGLTLYPQSVGGLLEYGIALQMLEGDAREAQTRDLYQRAAALPPQDAHEYLLVQKAQRGLPW